VDPEVHSRHGDHDAEECQDEAFEFVFAVAEGIGEDGLIEDGNCETVAAGIAEILGAEPLPALYFLVDPDGPGLLEGLFE
jgi:hypothetical protein